MLRATLAQVTEHLAGRRPRLDLPLDVRATAFQRQVWEALKAIPLEKPAPMARWRAPLAGHRPRVPWLAHALRTPWRSSSRVTGSFRRPVVRADIGGAVSGRSGCWRASDPAAPGAPATRVFRKCH